MDTIEMAAVPARSKRRRHSAEFKARVVAECLRPGVSLAAIALRNGLNANLLRRWVNKAEGSIGSDDGSARFVPVTVDRGSSAKPIVANSPASEIRIEIERAGTRVAVSWPMQDASSCAAWVRELLR
ncbi:MAG: transposase [Burkholderiaceae bacterium]